MPAIIIPFDKEDFGFYLNSGIYNWCNKHYQEALDDLRKSLSINPFFDCTHFYLGNTFLSLSDYKSAIRHYRFAADLRPDFPPTIFCLGTAYLKNGEIQAAILCYNRALLLKPNYFDALCARANVHFTLKYYREAVSDFNRAENIEELISADYTTRGLAYYYLGDKEKALDDWSKAAFSGFEKAKILILNGVPDL